METSLGKKLKRNILLDYCNVFITNLNMQSSIWVLYLAFKGMSLAQIGILEGIYHTTSMLFEIPSGAIADLLGRKIHGRQRKAQHHHRGVSGHRNCCRRYSCRVLIFLVLCSIAHHSAARVYPRPFHDGSAVRENAFTGRKHLPDARQPFQDKLRHSERRHPHLQGCRVLLCHVRSTDVALLLRPAILL